MLQERVHAGINFSWEFILSPWLFPSQNRPKMLTPHVSMSSDEIRERTQASGITSTVLVPFGTVLDAVQSLRGRLAPSPLPYPKTPPTIFLTDGRIPNKSNILKD